MSLPVLSVKGDYHQVGYRVGKHFKSRIQSAVEQSILNEILLPFYETPNGCSFVKTFLETCRSVYPQFVDEIKGMAEGSEIHFMHLYLLHIELEIRTHVGKMIFDTGEGCTDLYIVDQNEALMIHSEDGRLTLSDTGYMVQAVITNKDGSSVEESFTCYCYPGYLPGTAFTVNSHGVCSSLNILFQQKINPHGIPRRFVSRAMMSAKSIEDGINIAQRFPGIATGFNFNFAYKSSDGTYHVTSLELAGQPNKTTLVNRSDIGGFKYHFNDYIRALPIREAVQDPSSDHRYTTLIDIVKDKPPQCKQDLLTIMSDTRDKDYPIYRSCSPPDYLATAAICLFDLKAGKMYVYTDKPLTSEPIHVFSIPRHENNES